jgi:hypothetical protein
MVAGKGKLAALPAIHRWQMSWSDTPTKGAVTGIVRWLQSIWNDRSVLLPLYQGAAAAVVGQQGVMMTP